MAHYRLTPWAQAYWGTPDPSHFVLDEIVGALTVTLLPLFPLSPQTILIGFLLFRILDAIKLPGARDIDCNLHTAFGVLFDDVISALYSAAVLAILYALL